MGIIQETRADVRDNSADTVSDFNWGAFGFGWIWGLGNGSFKETRSILICELLMIIPIVNLIVFIVWLVLKIRAGVDGNKWAHENRAWNNSQDFKDTQGRYAKMFAVLVVIFVVGLIYGLANPSKDMLSFQLNKSHKGNKIHSQLEEVVDEIVSAQNRRGNLNSGEDVAEYVLIHSSFVRKRKSNMVASKYNSDSIKLELKNKPGIPHYIIRFKKEPSCSIKLKNCSVTMFKKGKPVGKAYYDDKGRVRQITVVTKK